VHILYAKSFAKDLGAINHDLATRKRLLKTIDKLKEINSLDELQGIKKIQGYESYYRLRIGDYRLGIKLSGDTIELIRFLHRRDIYRRFP